MKYIKQTILIVVLALSNPGCNKPATETMPNIIFILADDLGYGGLGCYGAKQIPTPNIDRLAREGIRFTDAHSPSAVCSPTRYGVLTGEYAWRSWLKNWVLMEHMPMLIDTAQFTVPKLLKQQGYATGCVGKWHLGWGDHLYPDWDHELRPGPRELGFDTFFGVPYSHNSSPELQVFVENSRIVGLNADESMEHPETMERVQRKLENTATDLSGKAVQFIRSNHQNPFFLYYPMTNIHLPHTPQGRFTGKSGVGKYGDFIVEMDWAVAEILNALDSLRITEKTLVIFTSDNGAKNDSGWTLNGHRPNGSLRGEKATIYEGGHRVPFVARWPGKINANSLCQETICLTDLMATCAGILQVGLPEGAGRDSENILPLLLGKPLDGPIREATVHHSVSGMYAIRKGKWKYIDGTGDGLRPTDWAKTQESGRGKPVWIPGENRFKDLLYDWPASSPAQGDPPGQLFDLESDPGESQNLYEQEPEVVRELKTLLEVYKSGKPFE